MKIILNNENLDIPNVTEISVADLLIYKKFSFPLLAIRINGNYVKKSDYATTLIHPEDDVIVLHMLSGG